MRRFQNELILSASDLVGHLNCRHLTSQDLQVADGKLAAPKQFDPLLDILRERGQQHEDAYLAHLGLSGHHSIRIDGFGIDDDSVAATFAAMRNGAEIIVQAALRAGQWSGRADVLKKVNRPSVLGSWSYEVVDTKLARETKGGTVFQLCLYSELLEATQGAEPEFAYVVVPWSDYAEEPYRLDDYRAYYRKVKAAAEASTTGGGVQASYPEPVAHCDVCRWLNSCEKRRRDDDHLTFVAGISQNQINELREHGVDRLAVLAEMELPIGWKPRRGSAESLENVARQARLQLRARTTGQPVHQLLEVEPGLGLCILPEPSVGDVFFDLEGDPFIGEHGLEYLFGYHYVEADGSKHYVGDWCFTRADEKAAFERFVDFVLARLERFPDLHIYHYAPYEPAALKRLMGRYATREDELDALLRGKRFVDLYSVVRHSLRASVESYSIKRLEPFYGYQRKVPLRDANIALSALQAALELADGDAVDEASKTAVLGYNQDDCVSTAELQAWLERLRRELVDAGGDVPRPEPGQSEASPELSAKQQRVNAAAARLLEGVPVDPEERNGEEQAQWILANILDWHRREEKAGWWEKYRLEGLAADDLFDEKSGLGGLRFVEGVPASGKLPAHRYRFPKQDTDIRAGATVFLPGGGKLGEVVGISPSELTVDIKKTGKTIDSHPPALFAHDMITAEKQAESLLRIGEHVAECGISGDGRYLAARDLLQRLPPRIGGEPLVREGEGTLDAAVRVAEHFEGGILPVQGPPGTGKSFTGARMICRFVERGLRVGITANSHKVIRNLIDKVLDAATELRVELRCVQKPGELEDDLERLKFVADNPTMIGMLHSGECQVGGATSFFWSREDAENLVDVLVVDEAGQMSLANVLAVSPAAKRLILLGDPQQLDQPTQGSHPDGTGGSALEHVLAGHQTIGPEQGLFLANTWRMSPAICAFDSEQFYESKLLPVAGSEQQLVYAGDATGPSLAFLAVPHSGNKSASLEEADAVAELVGDILSSGMRWIDRDGTDQPVTLKDILVITPYNAQVFEIQSRLPEARVGTVDKFQGQEAPIAIYTMATSSYAEAPRGMEFLYSANRFNVAVSRAKCQSILVASPDLFEAECRTPRQMQLVNAFCRYVELAIAT